MITVVKTHAYRKKIKKGSTNLPPQEDSTPAISQMETLTRTVKE